MPRNSALIGHLDKQLRDFTVTVMLPVFFVSVGLGTSIGLVAMSPGHLGLVAAILLVAVATKIVGAGLGARLAGLTARDALRIGALMNCRGLTELVVASIGYQFGLVNQFGLTALVLTALVTTLSTAPIMRLLDRIWTRRLSDSHQTL